MQPTNVVEQFQSVPELATYTASTAQPGYEYNGLLYA